MRNRTKLAGDRNHEPDDARSRKNRRLVAGAGAGLGATSERAVTLSILSGGSGKCRLLQTPANGDAGWRERAAGLDVTCAQTGHAGKRHRQSQSPRRGGLSGPVTRKTSIGIDGIDGYAPSSDRPL